MSLTTQKITEYDIPLSIDIYNGNTIYYSPDEDNEQDSDDDVSVDSDEIEEVHDILDDYKSIKFRDPQFEKFKHIKKTVRDKEGRIIKLFSYAASNFPLPLDRKDEVQPQIIHITGQQGSGKSFFTRQYIKQYIKYKPDNRIYLFSYKQSDEAYDDLEQTEDNPEGKIIRLKIFEPKFLTQEIGLDELYDALVIFDDVEQLEEEHPKIFKKVYSVKSLICSLGRCKQVYVITITHQPLAGNKTKKDNLELTAVVVFPASSKYHSRNLLEKYVGLRKEDIDKILNLKTRWVYVNKSIPRCIITKRRVELLD
jgi:hypothetical protein